MGGYLKMAGMIPEGECTTNKYLFCNKPAWQRLFIMSGGIFANIMIAAIIYIFTIYTNGTNNISNNDVVDGYTFSASAKNIGFCDGDKIISINGLEVSHYEEIAPSILLNNDTQIVSLLRDDKIIEVIINKENLFEMQQKGEV